MDTKPTDAQIKELNLKPLRKRILHKLFGHDWGVVKEIHEWWKYDKDRPLNPTSRRILRCNDCGLNKEQFFSEIFWEWLP